ncbi:MAG: NUDIX domain-containing protein [Candidatus Woesearchaeota archaeon]|nr:NUDIX domain-containing protein [Candidatus Woesearchaeota archaeon]
MEEVDVVDAHDNVVGKAKREEAHRKGLLHRVVFVMLFDADGRLYVQQRSLKKDLYPGFFEGSLSGHVLSGESYMEAAERELHEELGVCVSPRHLKDIVLFGFHDDEERVLVRLFAVKDFKCGVEPDTEGEVKSGEFWAWKKLEFELKGKKLFHPLFRKALEEFKAVKEKAVEFVKL